MMVKNGVYKYFFHLLSLLSSSITPTLPTSKQHRWHSFGQGPWPWDQPLCRGHLRGCRGGSQGVGGWKDGKGQDATQRWKEGLEMTVGNDVEKKSLERGEGLELWNLCVVKKRMLNVLLLDFGFFWWGKCASLCFWGNSITCITSWSTIALNTIFHDDFSHPHLPRLPN